MPIRESEKARYPKNWPQISQRIRERAEQRCECSGECGKHEHTCHVPNGKWIWRDIYGGQWWPWEEFGESAPKAETRVVGTRWGGTEIRSTLIVLTVAHLNHTPEDCRDENLKAMCQFCHLNYDAAHHAANAKHTRASKAGQMEMDLD